MSKKIIAIALFVAIATASLFIFTREEVSLKTPPIGLNNQELPQEKELPLLEPTPEPEVPVEPEVEDELQIALGVGFTLKGDQSAALKDEDFEIKIATYHNSPCPEGANCLWSGVGLSIEYIYKGELGNRLVPQGPVSVEVADYQVSVMDTDYETFANLRITKEKAVNPTPETYDINSWKEIILDSCQSFSDGCNRCGRTKGGVACTEMACEKYEKPECLD